jgi:hypothetical protein
MREARKRDDTREKPLILRRSPQGSLEGRTIVCNDADFSSRIGL